MLINDRFTDDSVNPASETEFRWRSAGGAGLKITQEINAVGATEKHLEFDTSTPMARIAGSLAPRTAIELGSEVNDTLTLKFDIRFDATALRGSELRFGLYDGMGTEPEGDSIDAMSDDHGYRFDLARLGGRIRANIETGKHAGIGGGSDTDKITTQGGGQTPVLSTNWHQVEIFIMRIPEGIGLILKLDDKELIRAMDDASRIQRFQHLFVGVTRPDSGAFKLANVELAANFSDAKEVVVGQRDTGDSSGFSIWGIVRVVLGILLCIACGAFWIAALIGGKPITQR